MSVQSDKHIYWLKWVKEWQQSNLSQQDFCNLHGLTIRKFWYWKTKILTESKKPKPTPSLNSKKSTRFIPVQVTTAPDKNTLVNDLTLNLSDGITITGINEHNLDLVKKLVGCIK